MLEAILRNGVEELISSKKLFVYLCVHSFVILCVTKIFTFVCISFCPLYYKRREVAPHIHIFRHDGAL